MTYAQEKIFQAAKALACGNSGLYDRIKETLPIMLKIRAVDLPVEARKKFSDVHQKLTELSSGKQSFYSDETLAQLSGDIMDVLAVVLSVRD